MPGDDDTTAKAPARSARQAPAPPAEPEPAPEPYAYVATEDLFVHDPESGVMPARAYSAGSLVPPADVKRHGWQESVRRPDEE